uniref:COP9 signalosome complex subunit 3 n=1 Tax=Rhodosorus marinus TaxID=101924 RepID=A0A7S3A647_9RHOD|mmetsp:Transcript_4852/g.20905  ORF Transcript_4852/g.20905 Transcript_4852/m.20905 type:complete len:363 (+) Transcript_4852:269-1357(+)
MGDRDVRSILRELDSCGSSQPAVARRTEKLVLASLEAVPVPILDFELARLSTSDFPKYCAVLAAKALLVDPREADGTSVIAAYQELVADASKGMFYSAPFAFSRLTRHVSRIVYERGDSSSVVWAARRALQLASPSPDHMTPMHADFLAVCVNAKMYHVAASLKTPKKLDSSTPYGLAASDVQLFYYYRSLVDIARADLSSAVESFKLLFAVPAYAVTDVSIDAYKKFVLTYLILHGKSPPKPSFVNHSVNLSLTQICGIYCTLGSLADANDESGMLKFAEENHGLFSADKNLGLVKKAIKVTMSKHIQKLAETYVTLSIDKIAEKLSLGSVEEAEKILLDMINSVSSETPNTWKGYLLSSR